jgi:hypothetical protein
MLLCLNARSNPSRASSERSIAVRPRLSVGEREHNKPSIPTGGMRPARRQGRVRLLKGQPEREARRLFPLRILQIILLALAAKRRVGDVLGFA